MRRIPFLFPLFLLLLLGGCMKWDYGNLEEDFDVRSPGLFILNEGNFQYGNSTLTFYNPATGEEINEAFFRANGMKLGDVAQSISIYRDLVWVVVNNSHVIFAIDPDTFKEKGRVENLTSPRYIHFVSPEKAYVTQLWDNRIAIINPKKFTVEGYIEVPGMDMQSGSTEQMVQVGRYVYCTCWSYQNRVLKIDTTTDSVVGSLQVGIQPRSIVKDCDDMLWVLTDGGYEGSVYGHEAPVLCRIDPASFSVTRRFEFGRGDEPRSLLANEAGDTLFWINDDLWRMPVGSERLPAVPFIESRGTRYYAMTVDPASGAVYVADAVDYQQQGMIYKFTSAGQSSGEFYVGVNPGAFCWK